MIDIQPNTFRELLKLNIESSCGNCIYFVEDDNCFCNWEYYHWGAQMVPFWKTYPEKKYVSKWQGKECKAWFPKLKFGTV